MMNYKLVVDKLQSVIPPYDGNGWCIELTENYSEGKDIKLIDLHNVENGNKYRLYHSELDDGVKTDKELLECCLESLQEKYCEIKSVMSFLLDNGYVMLGEMEE